MSEEIFRDDAYAKSCEAAVTRVDERGIILDRTVFYPESGGQAGDTGVLRLAGGGEIAVSDTIKSPATGEPLHVPAEGAPSVQVGDKVTAEIDWARRHRLMRMHTAMHLLCAVIEGDVTGGKIGEAKSRLDFNLPDTSLDKEHIGAELNRLVAENHPISPRWISDEEMAAQPELVRTMSVKPPSGQGKVRLLDIAGVDLQPCGGTHVRETAEIGRLRVGKIENKGRQNRRVNIALDD